MEWKPIKEAPKGREILVYDPRMNSIEIRIHCLEQNQLCGFKEIWKDRYGSFIFDNHDLLWLEIPKKPEK